MKRFLNGERSVDDGAARRCLNRSAADHDISGTLRKEIRRNLPVIGKLSSSFWSEAESEDASFNRMAHLHPGIGSHGKGRSVAVALKDLLIGLVRHGWSYRKFQLHGLAARNADALTFEPADIGLESRHRTRLKRRRGFKRNQEHRLVAIPVGQDVAALDMLLREGPLHLSGSDSRRQLPGNGGGQPGFTGVLPVRMPAPVHAHQDANREARSRLYAPDIGHQPD